MILFFDTETTGLPDFNARAREPHQPHIVQLAAMLTHDDGKVVESHKILVKPEGWSIPAETSAVHGITDEIAANGISEVIAASLLLSMIRRAKLVVAHNIKFDKFIARIAMRRFELITDAEDEWWKGLPTYCTMWNTTELCNLPGKIAGRPKFPKLSEAYQHIFKRMFDGAHDALADLNACREIYFWLQSGGAK